MGVKRVIDSEKFIVDGDLSADFISVPVNILHIDRVAVELAWTGDPTGPFEVQVSNTGDNWETVDATAAAAGSAGSAIVEIETSCRLVRVFFDSTSGSGTLSSYLTAKSISG